MSIMLVVIGGEFPFLRKTIPFLQGNLQSAV
jgi:hypothetical protein